MAPLLPSVTVAVKLMVSPLMTETELGEIDVVVRDTIGRVTDARAERVAGVAGILSRYRHVRADLRWRHVGNRALAFTGASKREGALGRREISPLPAV